MKVVQQHRILIIENNELYRKMLAKRLESAGFGVVTAQDGLEGLKAVRKEKPDLVILDILLPGLDGHKICRMIKFDKKLGHIPVVVLTSRDLDQVADLAKQVKADAFCVKTTKAPVLIDIIQKLIDRTTNKDSSES
jgi:CheY-like chemotaxis protein